MRLLAAFVAAALLASSSGSQEPLKLATGNGYPPFSDEALPGRGLATSVVEAILKDANVPYEIEFVPWSRAEKLTADGRYVATFPYVKTPERELVFDYVARLFHVTVRLFVRSGGAFPFTRLEDARGKTLCKPAGYAWESQLKPFLDAKIIKAETPPDLDSCLRMLRAGRVDAISESDFVMWPAVEKLYGGDTSGFEALELPIQSNDLFVVVSKKHPRAKELVGILERGLVKLRAAGTFPQLAP